MKKLYLCFLWHMHQPWYRDGDVYKFPWVFLHAAKDYTEMLEYYRVYDVVATFNITPSLLVQLEEYADPLCPDTFLNLLRKPVDSLSIEEKKQLIPQLFMAQPHTMIRDQARYQKLYEKYQIHPKDVQVFSLAEILTLEICFLLAWVGTWEEEKTPFFKKLKTTSESYTEADKHQILGRFHAICAETASAYRELKELGKIEISTTPYYHPILPLLLNLEDAKESEPSITLPQIRSDLSKFANMQMADAIMLYKTFFSDAPSGMWPAEGSVSYRAADLFAKHHLSWIATDEDILSQSLHLSLEGRNRSSLYQKWRLKTDHGPLYIFFRDKVLSDLIGFVYSNQAADTAVSDFIRRLQKIYDESDTSIVVPVILDGENAWEFYPKNARPFFDKLYKAIEKSNFIETRTFSQISAESSLPEGALDHLAAGSWIYANFSTWVGHYEKNKAWNLLNQTVLEVRKVLPKLDSDVARKVTTELLIAQGSDWFWWYGDDHYSAQADLFDTLFRKHLIRSYELCSLRVPVELYTPITTSFKKGLIKSETALIHPICDGKASYFEWLGAGEFDLTFDMSSMHKDAPILSKLFWGVTKENNLCLCLDGRIQPHLDTDFQLEIAITNTKTTNRIKISLSELYQKIPLDFFKGFVEVMAKDVIEIIFPPNMEDLRRPASLQLVFSIYQNDVLIEKAPFYKSATISFENRLGSDWLV